MDLSSKNYALLLHHPRSILPTHSQHGSNGMTTLAPEHPAYRLLRGARDRGRRQTHRKLTCESLAIHERCSLVEH